MIARDKCASCVKLRRARHRVGERAFGRPAGPGYTARVKVVSWDPDEPAEAQIQRLCTLAQAPEALTVVFGAASPGRPPSWRTLEKWIGVRAVTMADIRVDVGSPALEAALCCDLVIARRGVRLTWPSSEELPSAGLLWAAGRSGRQGLMATMFESGPVPASRANTWGLVHAVLGVDEALPDIASASHVALSVARDLLRTSAVGMGALELELAAFRLLFAVGEPEEGARAFLEHRDPQFRP